MTKNFNRMAVVKSKNGDGLLWAVPVGTVTSLDPSVDLPASAVCVGTISDSGVVHSEDTDTGNPTVDSDGDNARTTAGTSTRTLTFTPWEVDTKAAMSLVFNAADIQADADGKVTGIDDTGRSPNNVKLIMEFETDTNRIGRWTFHECVFQSRGDWTTNYDQPAGSEIVYTVVKSGGLPYSQKRVADRVDEDGE